MPRRHRATGNPRGGKREGAGRPSGAPDSEPRIPSGLPYGSIQALSTTNFRIPPGTDETIAGMANMGLARIYQVMMGEVHPDNATAILKGATRIRDEVCGPPAQKLEHAGPNGKPLDVKIEINRFVEPTRDEADE